MFLFLFTIYILFLLGIKLFSDKLSKIVYFSFVNYWMIPLMISVFNPYGLFVVPDKIYFYILLGVVSFLFGFIIYPNRNTYFANQNNDKLLDSIYSLINGKLMKFLFVLMILLVLYTYIKSAAVLAYLHSMDRGRGTVLMEMVFEGNSFYAISYNMFAPSFFHLSLFFVSFLLIYGNKCYKDIIFYSIYIFLYASIGGGRYSFISIIIYLMLFYIIRKFFSTTIYFSSKKIISIILVSVISLLLVSKISYEREFRGETVKNIEQLFYGTSLCVKDFAVYNLTPFRLFSYAIENNYRDKLSGVNLSATFEGFDPYLRVIAKSIGFDYNEDKGGVTSYLQNNWIYTGVGESNYIYTAMLFHYIDMGIFGLIIFPCIFGIIYRHIIDLFYKTKSVYSLLLVFFLYFMMLNTLLTCYLLKIFAIPYCVVLYFLSKKSITYEK